MFKLLTLKKHTPRWLILFIDLTITVISILFAFLLRFNFNINDEYFKTIQYVILYVLIVRLTLFLITKTYAGIIRYTGSRDTLRILLVVIYSNAFYVIFNLVAHLFFEKTYIIPFSIIFIDFFVSIFLLTGFRLFVKTIYSEVNNFFKEEKRIVILGINESAITTKRVLTRDTDIKYKVEAFINPNDTVEKKQLDGVGFYNLNELSKVFSKYEISELIIAEKSISPTKKQEIINLCFEHDVNVLTLPEVKDWINGELSYNQIRKIKIEDLLEREPIKLNELAIKNDILNKTILVTGAAGSIGSEIVIQLTKFRPKNIIVFDQAESPLYDLELELKEKHNFLNYNIVIGSITNKIRVNKIFETFKPDIVFHAAAYKHVPMMENNPSEAIKTNVLGTKVIADASVEFNINKFVMISTDKAVNPTNVMGASKRIAEVYIQTLQQKNNTTSFITTRFGNVLGSNGSVIPRFRQQIEGGGPVTITDPEITRFFMTISEACQLVLQAGAIGNGGDIFIFDMGKSVKIIDLAKKMIKLSGLKLGTDINLKFTGLRPGEKLYEELLADAENTMPTEHKKIMIAKTREYNNDIIPQIDTLLSTLKEMDNFKTVSLMKKIIPEYISRNSIYESLNIKDN